jgi:hypothetical protein
MRTSVLDRKFRAVLSLASVATIATVLVAAAPGTWRADSVPVSIAAAKYVRLSDSKAGPSIRGPAPVLPMPRGYTYRVTLVGNGIDLVQTIVPGNPAILGISNIRRRNGLETGGPGELLFDVSVNRQTSTAYQRVPINFFYVTGQRDRMSIEVHPGGRISSMSPRQVQAGEPVVVTYTGTDLSEFVLSGGGYSMLRVLERSPTRLRIEYVFPVRGATTRTVVLGSQPTYRDQMFAFAGLRHFTVDGATPILPPSIPGPPPTGRNCRPGQVCP